MRQADRASCATGALLVFGLYLAGCERRVPVAELEVNLEVVPRAVTLSDSAAWVVVRTRVQNPHWHPVEVHLGGPPIRWSSDLRRDQGTTWGYHIRAIAPDSGGWRVRGRVRDMERPLLHLLPWSSRSVHDTLAVRRGRLRPRGNPAWLTDQELGPGRYEIRGSFNRLQTPPETLVVRP